MSFKFKLASVQQLYRLRKQQAERKLASALQQARSSRMGLETTKHQQKQTAVRFADQRETVSGARVKQFRYIRRNQSQRLRQAGDGLRKAETAVRTCRRKMQQWRREEASLGVIRQRREQRWREDQRQKEQQQIDNWTQSNQAQTEAGNKEGVKSRG